MAYDIDFLCDVFAVRSTGFGRYLQLYKLLFVCRKAAERTIRRIKDLVESLSFMPERFALAESLSFRGMALRKAPVDGYCVYYVVMKDIRKVVVARIMHKGCCPTRLDDGLA